MNFLKKYDKNKIRIFWQRIINTKEIKSDQNIFLYKELLKI